MYTTLRPGARWLLTLVLQMVCLHALAQQVQVVAVTASGYGQTEAHALADAVVNAVAQVNGETVAATMRLSTRANSSASGDSGVSAMSRTIEEDISRRTQGAVASWRRVSAELSPAGDYSASAVVNVYVLQKSQQLERIKLAVVPGRSGDPRYSGSLSEELTRNLTTSRKFALMDRRNHAEIEAQLARIARTGSAADSVRQSAEVAPDFIAVVGVTTTSRSDGRTAAVGTIEIIDYSTRQIRLSEKKSIPLRPGDEASNLRRLALLARGLSRTVIQTIYPPVVIGQDGAFITIGQGSDFFSMGDRLIVKKMGAALRDPHTGEYLSQEQTDVGTAIVTYVDARIARARLSSAVTMDQTLLVDHKYQVWRSGETAGDLFGGSFTGPDTAPASSAGTKPRRVFSTGGDDDE
jgi:hypothetical protein